MQALWQPALELYELRVAGMEALWQPALELRELRVAGMQALGGAFVNQLLPPVGHSKIFFSFDDRYSTSYESVPL